MPFLDIALPLLDRGFSVIPLKPKSKEPYPGIGVLKRTRDYWQCLKWAERFPDANVAICADDNIGILESDDFEEFKRLVVNATGNQPQTFMTLSACGSDENRPHLFFKRTERMRHTGNLALPGVFEARFSNQYVVGPGSTHPSGATYRWLNDAPIVEIPDWLVSGLAHLAMSNQAARRNPRVNAGLDGKICEGGRHYALVSEAGRLWDGKITEEELYGQLSEFNDRYCDPPREASHVLATVRDIMRRQPNDPGPRVLLGGQAPIAAGFKYPRVNGRIRDYTLLPLNGPYDGWFPRGRLSIVGGSSGTGKTTLIVSLLDAQRDRRLFLGHVGAGLDFLVLFADRTDLSNRETLERMGLADRNINIGYMPVCWDAVAVATIKDKIEDNGCPPAVFVEGADALVADANKAQIVAPFMSALQAVAKHYHIAIILSCGAPKQKPKDQYAQTRDRVFGSQMWARMSEDVLVLSQDTDSDRRHLVVEHRNAPKEVFTLGFQNGLLVEVPDLPRTKAVDTDSQSEMIEKIEALPQGTKVGPRDFPWLSESVVYKNLRALSRPEAGWVDRDRETGKWITLKSREQ